MPRRNLVKQGIETSHRGNRSQTVKDSNNVIQYDNSGSGNVTNIYQSSKSDGVSKIHVNEVANGFTVLGRWLLGHLGINKFRAFMIISLTISGYFSADMLTVKLLPQNTEIYITALGIIWLALTLFISGLYVTRTCKKCGRRFALEEISKTLLSSAKYRGSIHHDTRSVYKCYFCGAEVVEESVDVEEVDGR